MKGKSRRIGLKLPLNDEVWRLMRNDIVYGFDRRNIWHEWSGGKSTALAGLLDYNNSLESSISDLRELRESSMLCAPLATRDGVLGVLKVAARHPGSFSRYEADLVQRFMPLAATAISKNRYT